MNNKQLTVSNVIAGLIPTHYEELVPYSTLCGKPLNREGGVKNLCCLSEASYIDFSRASVKFNERSTRSLDFSFFLSRKRTKHIFQLSIFN